jgi:hypothetical protein
LTSTGLRAEPGGRNMVAGHSVEKLMRRVLAAAALVLLAACTSGPRIRSDYDRSANFAAYRTYGFAAELGTDRAGYSTLVTGHFRRAVSREMESRGYVLATQNPDVLVNFFTSVRDRTEVRSTPRVSVGLGYYGYRSGLYTTWPLYGRDVDSTTYQIGTASIDVVDAARRQLIWEGTAEGVLTNRVIENPGPAIDKAVAQIFQKYPVTAGGRAGYGVKEPRVQGEGML